MSENKTEPTDADVAAYLAQVEPQRRREDAEQLDEVFRRVTGFLPRLWGPSIIGYGRYHYRYDSGREGDFLATGFAPRKASLVIYIMPGYADFSEILGRLGKHRLGKSCLYINKMSDINKAILEELIRAGLEDLGRRWDVLPE
ncbi:DUF1801 domain-containing protein [Alisedimentitalea sp. MJ-SS2]|uniref:DUF1801 domain-containing protein n=1 Tax=Aliisedimentitalea sp. MJ-SS2 TaxID=3049795 RepID=UPI002908AC8E|nr:DUF1801 domain-containing protein [Alisedimentitalea sp. MJ-SS2]MDU8928872.1 DUF1801 domain-containing protein [Alisedimentitalea sp. MJ-SS2]